MPMFLSLLSLGCFAGAGATFFRYDGHYFELLITCAVVLLAAAEIVSSIRNARPEQASNGLEHAEVVRELREINNRLVKVQLAIEQLETPSQPRRS
jgi:hypothetical protein